MGLRLALSDAKRSFMLSRSFEVPSKRCFNSSYASSISSSLPFVSQAGLFGFPVGFAGVFAVPSLEGGLSDPALEAGLLGATGPRTGGALVPGPTLLDIFVPPETTRLLGLAIGLPAVVGGLAPGPTVLDRVFRVVGVFVILEVDTLLAIVEGFAGGCFGATALSANVIRLAAGGFNPVSGSLRLAAPRWVAASVAVLVMGPTNWDVVRGSS
jgi:hypothetical protein